MSFKAHEKRVKTLLVEYQNNHKSNKFTDKRIGENDKNLSLEDKMFKRFVAERQKAKNKKTKFNLNDDDYDAEPQEEFELTHYGQKLSQIEKFERVPISDDDDDEDDPNSDRGKLNAELVSQNFFGGFKDNEDKEGKKKSRKEWIEEMIVKSKQLKYEKQKEKDRTLDLTEQLDKEWKDLIPIIGRMDKNLKEQEPKILTTNSKPDDYDVLVRTLQFDSKAQPTNKLKTVEELEKEKSEEVKKQEKELLERMNKEIEPEEEEEEETKRKKKGMKKAPSNHISVDDMEFNEPEYLELRNREELTEKHKKMNEELEKQNKKVEEEEEDEQDEEDIDNENEDNVQEEEEDEEEGEEEEEEEEDEEEEYNENEEQKDKSDENQFKNDKWIQQFEAICVKMNKNSINLEQFDKMLKSIIDKLDPSKDENNKKRLCLLTKHLINYYQSLFEFKQTTKRFIDIKLVNLLTKYIYEFTSKYGNKSTKKEPSSYVTLFKEILLNLNRDYLNLRLSERRFPSLSALFTFKLISRVFPTSDFRHQIITPCLLIMTRYLTQCSVQTVGDLFRGSFLCNLCYEFVNKSQRYIPECVQYLNGVLLMFLDLKNLTVDEKKTLGRYELSTIFESFKKSKLKFIISNKIDKLNELSLVNTSLNESQTTDDSTNASIIGYNLDLLAAFVKLYEPIETFREIFSLTNTILKLIKSDNYPNELKNKLSNIQELIEKTSDKTRLHLKCLIKKPVPNKQFEPKIIAKNKFDPRHHNTVISEKQLMARKYKKELKSAIKEIRQDSEFLARVQLKEQMENDARRSKKVKEIMSSLANQEGEYQKIKRQKI